MARSPSKATARDTINAAHAAGYDALGIVNDPEAQEVLDRMGREQTKALTAKRLGHTVLSVLEWLLPTAIVLWLAFDTGRRFEHGGWSALAVDGLFALGVIGTIAIVFTSIAWFFRDRYPKGNAIVIWIALIAIAGFALLFGWIALLARWGFV